LGYQKPTQPSSPAPDDLPDGPWVRPPVADLARADEATIETTIAGWLRALHLRDHETWAHTQRVTAMTIRLARAMGMGEPELLHLRRGALLHDIGKMGIPDDILLKAGPLSGEEWEVMRRHPTYAYEWLVPIPAFRPALDIPYCHHEKWDGTGYPRGLKGEQIPLAARIFAAVDICDALRSDRPYRRAWPEWQAREHIRSLAGTHLDPRVVEKFFRVISTGPTADSGHIRVDRALAATG
jgi:putative nucleotidyltransferase with HDIG domain